MNKRQAKKKSKKEQEEYLRATFSKEDIECIKAKCPYFDFVGVYGGGCCANNSNHCRLA